MERWPGRKRPVGYAGPVFDRRVCRAEGAARQMDEVDEIDEMDNSWSAATGVGVMAREKRAGWSFRVFANGVLTGAPTHSIHSTRSTHSHPS